MNVVGKVSSFITQGVYSVATPFHPFGGAVDIIVVKQQDGTFRSTPWYVRFGKFQGVLKGAEKVVRIEVNGVEANFHMYLDNSGEAYFITEVVSDKGKEGNEGLKDFEGIREDSNSVENNSADGRNDNVLSGPEINDFSTGEMELLDERVALGVDRLHRTESDSDRTFYEFQDEQSSLGDSADLSEFGSNRYESLDRVEHVIESQNSSSEVVLVSIDGHILTAPLSSSERTTENVQLNTPQFHLGPAEGTDFCDDDAEFSTGEAAWPTGYLTDMDRSSSKIKAENVCQTSDQDIAVCHPSEDNEGDGEHLCQVKESPDVEDQEKASSKGTTRENSPARINRDNVFKSCLELSEFALQDGNDNQMQMGSPSHDVEYSQERSPQSPMEKFETADKGTSQSTNDDGFSPPHSESPCSSTSPDSVVQLKVETTASDIEINSSDGMVNGLIDHDEKADDHKDSVLAGITSPKDALISQDECNSSGSENVERHSTTSTEDSNPDSSTRIEISLCRNLLRTGMGLEAAAEAFDKNRITEDEFRLSAASIIKSENLVVKIQGKYLPWDKAAPVIVGRAAFGLDLQVEPNDAIPVEEETPKSKEDESGLSSTPSGRRWRLWPIPFRRVKTIEHTSSNASTEEVFVDSESGSQNQPVDPAPASRSGGESPHKQLIRTNVPTTEQIASLNLKEGQNMVTFIFSTRVLGVQKVEAHIYVWKWNTRIVISDVDGTITKSDVLGQFMPLVGKDWTHSGIARLFSAIKENGYQLLFLSARAIVQAYLTKSFLFNLKQDGKTLPNGPVVISPDGLFPSLYREVIRRAPHEFKIACLEDIKALFPPDYNPFYAGFGNRDTDELSYRKIGIPKGKIFIINPKGEVAISHRIDVKSYTSLHTLVNDMFPPTSLIEQEDYNSWNYWRMPLPDIDS